MAMTDYATEARIAYLRWAASAKDEEAERVRLWRDYAAGDHPTYLTDRQEEFLGLRRGEKYRHNICGLVIDMAVERLQLQGFAPLDEGAQALADMGKAWWDANRMDATQDVIYRAAARDSVAYVMVDWDGDHPRWTVHYAWDGTQGIYPCLDSGTGAVAFYVKRWVIYNPLNKELNGRTRMNLYFPDRIEKYITTRTSNSGIGGTMWEEFQDEGDAGWPIPWTDARGEPLGFPLVAFENPGGSEIQDLMPIQDMLNKADLDLIAATDSAGFRILYVTGVPPKVNKGTGEEEPLTLGPGKVLRFTDAAARIGAIDPVDLSQLIAVARYWIMVGAGITRTPQYLFQAMGADQPSGESLRMQEMGLVAKYMRKQKVFGNAWEDVLYLSAKLWNMYRPGEAVPGGRVQTQWAEVTVKDEAALMQALLQKLQMGVPEKQLWAEMGYDQATIEMFEASRETEGKVGTSLLQQFLAGRGQKVEGRGGGAEGMA